MSSDWGEVIHAGKGVGFFIFNGTVSLAERRIAPTIEDAWANRGGEHVCDCGETPVTVMLYSDYGGGFHWPARACLKCKCIVAGTNPYGATPDEQDEPDPFFERYDGPVESGDWPKPGMPVRPLPFRAARPTSATRPTNPA